MHPAHAHSVQPGRRQDALVSATPDRPSFAEAVDAFARALADPALPFAQLLRSAYAFGAACEADARPPEHCVRMAKEMAGRAFPWFDRRNRAAECVQLAQATITATIHGYYGRSQPQDRVAGRPPA